MRRVLVALLLSLFVSANAWAGTTWSSPVAAQLLVKGVDTTGTGSAPTLATDGFPLSILAVNNGITVFYESTAAAFTACSLQCYLFLPQGAAGAGLWSRAPDLDLTVQALTSQAFTGFRVASPRNRIAFVPSGCGQPGNIWINGTAAH
jgi:hypothetical protein